MIEIRNVHKYFNKGKKNEIHVINNTTLTLEDNGLVALLGASGSGKTTLLNAIGGLDKVRSGNIYINGEKITSKNVHRVDKIRNLNIGYIFQDYKLLDNMTVYNNVALVLTMIGIKDKKEIKKRVEFVLEKVGMLRYQKRPAGMLSGGERQRVGIARALVKNPNIILADEPTGNLDSKNSLEIMKIIKAISKERLVILVTHEQNLAKFYASRIIEMKDGTVMKDYENNQVDTLDYEIDNCFYLKDFPYQNSIQKDPYHINIYSETNEKLDIEIVVKNGNIYIQSKTGQKVEAIDENSSIDFIWDHYKKLDKKDCSQYQFNLNEIISPNEKKRYSSIFSFGALLRNGFQKIWSFSFLKKMLLVGFFLSGMFIMYAFSSVFLSLDIKEEDFLSINPNYLTVMTIQTKVEDYLKYEQMESVNYMLPKDSKVTFQLKYSDYYQTSQESDSLTGSLSSIKWINKEELLYGRMPENVSEIIVDKSVIEKMFKRNLAKMAGVITIEDMLDRSIMLKNMNDFTIVGIVDKKSPSIYVDESQFINIISNSSNAENENGVYNSDISYNAVNTLVDYSLYQDKITVKEGKIPGNDYEIIVPLENKDNMPLNKEIDIKIDQHKLKVVGYYTSKHNYNYYFTTLNTIKYQLISSNSNFVIYSNDKDVTIKQFQKLGLNIKNSYDQSKNEYLNSKKDQIKSTLLVSGIILLISLIEIFLMIRSSFLSRIKEIGIYRAIGVKKSDIYKMFISEIFAITTLGSLPGLLFMAYILKVLSGVSYLSRMFMININILLLAIIFVYLFNLIVGLFPVYHTIRKRPAEILARHDLD